MVYKEDERVKKLAKKLMKALKMRQDEAISLIYEEWDLVEPLIQEGCNNCNEEIVEQLNEIYNIA